MEHTPTTKTVSSVLASKLAAFIEAHSFTALVTYLGLVFLAGYLSSVVVDASGTWSFTVSLLRWHDWAPVKVIGTFAAVWNARTIWTAVFGWLIGIIEMLSGESVTDTIDGIPTTELLDWLFTHQSFKREEVKAHFGIAHHRYNALAQKLEDLGVLIRGENNARILNDDYSRQDIASILRGKGSSKDLEPLFRRKTEHHFTSDPSASEIEERVNTLLSPAPNFSTRKIPQTAGTSHVQRVSKPRTAPRTTDRTTVPSSSPLCSLFS